MGLSRSGTPSRSGSRHELASGSAGSQNVSQNQPLADSPRAPAPARPPSSEQVKSDPLLDYLLGGGQ
jgi:hypothetical protein